MALGQLGDEPVQGLLGRGEPVDRAAAQVLQRLDGVVGLGLQEQQHRRVAGPGVGPVQEEHVGEPRGGRAVVGRRPARPLLVNADPALADDVDRVPEVVRVEPGGPHQHVQVDVGPIAQRHPVGGHLGDVGGVQVHVVAVQRRVVDVGEHQPLAAGRDRRGDLLPQRLVGHTATDVPLPEGANALLRPLLHGQGGVDLVLGHPVHPCAQGGVGARHPQRGPLDHGEVALEPGQHPRGGALEHVEVGGLLGDRGDDLHRGRAGADDPDPLAGHVDVGVPAGGVERGAREPLAAGHLRERGDPQQPEAVDDDLGLQHLAVLQRHLPDRPLVVPALLGDPDAQPGPVAQPVLGHHLQDVGLDGRLGREERRPRVRLVAQGVQRGGDVAGAAGVDVVAPGAAELLGPVHDRDVVVQPPGLLQREGHGDAAEPCADDDDPDVPAARGSAHGWLH